MRVCAFCACTDDQACQIAIADLGTLDLIAAVGHFMATNDERRDEQLPAELNCWWISYDPPVCSSPMCREWLAQQLERRQPGHHVDVDHGVASLLDRYAEFRELEGGEP